MCRNRCVQEQVCAGTGYVEPGVCRSKCVQEWDVQEQACAGTGCAETGVCMSRYVQEQVCAGADVCRNRCVHEQVCAGAGVCKNRMCRSRCMQEQVYAGTGCVGAGCTEPVGCDKCKAKLAVSIQRTQSVLQELGMCGLKERASLLLSAELSFYELHNFKKFTHTYTRACKHTHTAHMLRGIFSWRKGANRKLGNV